METKVFNATGIKVVPPQTSKRFSLNKKDLTSLGKSVIIASVGAICTIVLEGVGNIDFGANTPFVTAGLAVLANLIRKFLADNAVR